METTPLFDRARPPAVATGQTPPSTCGDKPRPTSPPKPPPVPAAIRNLIAELGLRYRPSSQADLEAHAGQLALLARDLADLPPKALAAAIDVWVKDSPFLPRASDLVTLAKRAIEADRPRSSDHRPGEREPQGERAQWRRRRDEGNRMVIRDGLERRMHWITPSSGLGCELVGGAMPADLYEAAMKVDPAVLPHRGGRLS